MKGIEVVFKKSPIYEADGTIHRRRVVVVRMILNNVHQPIPPVDFRDIPHQRGGDVYKGSFHFRRKVNRIW